MSRTIYDSNETSVIKSSSYCTVLVLVLVLPG